MIDHKFHTTQTDHCVFVKKYDGGDFLILLLYVDDMLIVRQDLKKIASLKRTLSKSFAMKDMGSVKQILGNAHSPGPDKEHVVAVTREICDKDLEEVQHVGSKASWLCVADKL